MNDHGKQHRNITRRDFIKASAAAAGAMAVVPAFAKNVSVMTGKTKPRPNFLFLNLDQLSCEAIRCHGCAAVKTPNLDRLARQGISFTQSYSANPVCCPARSAWFSGRYTPETGVMNNGLPMAQDVPDLGQWLRQNGYQTFHTGKWHIPKREVGKSFTVLGPDPKNTASLGDIVTTRGVEGFLRNYDRSEPFFLAAGLLNPHDICSFVLQNMMYGAAMPYPELADRFPPLSPNFDFDMTEPKAVVERRQKYMRAAGNEAGLGGWKEDFWRYYIWSYYQYIAMVDGQVGMILDALQASRFAGDTLVILSADHGDGHARHKMVFKSFLYDEAARTPFMISWPGRLLENIVDNAHLASGVDLVPTVCDFSGVPAPPDMRGYSLRPLAEGSTGPWRDFVVAHTGLDGRMIRTEQYKLIAYKGDPAVQLFDMKNDPWETKNLAEDLGRASLVKDHLKTLDDYEATFKVAALPKGRSLPSDNEE